MLCTAPLSAQSVFPLSRGPYDFTYEQVFREGIHAGNLELLNPIRPYSVSLVRAAPDATDAPLISLHDVRSVDDIRLFTVSSERLHARRGASGDDLPALSGGFSYQPSEYFSVLSYVILDRARAIDPDYTGKVWRGLAGEVETASLYFHKNAVAASLGRQRVSWGPTPVNLSLSRSVDPLDQLSFTYSKGRLSFNFMFARLDNTRPDSSDYLRLADRDFENDNRYLVGHRLDLRLHNRLCVGFFETVVYGGEGRPPELYYLNPLQFFHAAQLNENEDDNTILGGDFTWLPVTGAALYGQFIVDDLQVDKSEQSDQEPDEVGFMFGAVKTGKIGTLLPDLRVEYTMLTNRTYHQSDPKNRYLYRNRIIGHPLGPDSDSLSFALRFWPSADFFTEIEFSRRRHGEGSVFDPWDTPWALSEGDYDEPFPTGTVEKSYLFALRTQGYLPFTDYTRRHFFVALDTGYGKINNTRNQFGHTSHTTWLDISISWLGYVDVGLE
jgi:hypothetical protein